MTQSIMCSSDPSSGQLYGSCHAEGNNRVTDKAIESKAIHNATQIINNHFQTESSLDEIEALRYRYNRELAFTTESLNETREQKEDTIYGTYAALERISQKVHDLKLIMSSLRNANVTSPSNLYRTKLGNAKQNIASTMSTLDEIDVSSQQISELKNELTSSHDNGNCGSNIRSLQTSFQQIEELRTFREGIMVGLYLDTLHESLPLPPPPTSLSFENKTCRSNLPENQELANKSVFTSHSNAVTIEHKVPQACKSSTHHSESQSNSRELTKKHICAQMSDIADLSAELRNIVKNNILNCVELGQKDPAFLVSVVETMITIDAKDHRRSLKKKSDIKSHPMEHTAETSVFSQIADKTPKKTFQNEVLGLLRKKFGERIRDRFTTCVFQAVDADRNVIDATLGASSEGIVDLLVIKRYVSPCFPKDCPVEKLYLEEFEAYMIPQIKALYKQRMETIEVKDIFQLIAWIQHYCSQSKTEDDPEKKHCPDFGESINDLLNEYLAQIKSQLKKWMTNATQIDQDIFCNNDGNLVTSYPEDILNLLNMQIAVASEHLEPCHSVQVALLCLDELCEMQEQIRTKLDGSWKDMEVERLCSTVNDFFRLYEKCETFGLANHSSYEEIIKEKADDVCLGYIKIALHVTTLVREIIMKDLEEPVISHVLTPRWENEEDLIAVSIRTFQDYFKDLRVWLPDYFYSKCVKQCFDEILKCYVKSFFSKKKSCQNTWKVSQTLERDSLGIVQYFGIECASQIETSGTQALSFVNDRLELLRCMSRVLLAKSEDAVTSEISVMQRELGNYVVPVILHLLRMKPETIKCDLSPWMYTINYEYRDEANIPRFALDHLPKTLNECGSVNSSGSDKTGKSRYSFTGSTISSLTFESNKDCTLSKQVSRGQLWNSNTPIFSKKTWSARTPKFHWSMGAPKLDMKLSVGSKPFRSSLKKKNKNKGSYKSIGSFKTKLSFERSSLP